MNYRNFHIITRIAFILPALALLVSACSKEVLEPSFNGEEAAGIGNTVRLQVVLHCSNALQETSSITSPNETEPGVGYETTIKNATLYLYHSKSKKLYRQFNLHEFSLVESSSNDAIYKTDSIVINIGTYDIFVIANCNNVPVNVENESDFLNSIDNVTYVNGVVQSIGLQGIVMTNTPNSFQGKEFGYSEKGHKIDIALEHVLGKISISLDSASYTLNGPSVGTYATVNLTNVKIVNAPRSYYLFKHTAKLTDFREPADGYDYFAERNEEDDDVYVIDPGFFKKTTTPDSATIDNYYAEWYKHPGASVEAPISHYGKSILYVTENPVYKSVQKKAYVTGLLFKGAIIPSDGSVWYWSTTTPVGPMRETIREQWPDTLYFYKYKFYKSIHDLNKCTGLSLDESKQGLYTDTELKGYKVKQIVKVMGTYQTKYAYWIRHNDNDNEAVRGPKEFSIIRNNYYKLCLKKITGIGRTEIDPQSYLEDVEPNSYSDIEFYN